MIKTKCIKCGMAFWDGFYMAEGKCHETDNERISNIKSLDMYFPKGDKRRGEALVLCAEAFLLGKESAGFHGEASLGGKE